MKGQISLVAEEDLPDLLPLMRGYSDFYKVDPSDHALLALALELIADPAKEGVQLIARGEQGEPLGFATIYWMWSTSQAARIGIMNDLFVDPAARGGGVGEALIATCLELVRERGAVSLQWQTAPDNTTAQKLYDRVGAVRENWFDYHLDA